MMSFPFAIKHYRHKTSKQNLKNRCQNKGFFWKKWANPGLFFFIFVISTQLTVNIQYYFLPMTRFEPWTYGFRGSGYGSVGRDQLSHNHCRHCSIALCVHTILAPQVRIPSTTLHYFQFIFQLCQDENNQKIRCDWWSSGQRIPLKAIIFLWIFCLKRTKIIKKRPGLAIYFKNKSPMDDLNLYL